MLNQPSGKKRAYSLKSSRFLFEISVHRSYRKPCSYQFNHYGRFVEKIKNQKKRKEKRITKDSSPFLYTYETNHWEPWYFIYFLVIHVSFDYGI